MSTLRLQARQSTAVWCIGSKLPFGEVAGKRVVDGPALLRREDNDLTVLLAGAGNLDLTE